MLAMDEHRGRIIIHPTVEVAGSIRRSSGHCLFCENSLGNLLPKPVEQVIIRHREFCAGFRDRVLGNPRFLVVLAIEFAMGASAKWSAEVQARGEKFWPVRWLPRPGFIHPGATAHLLSVLSCTVPIQDRRCRRRSGRTMESYPTVLNCVHCFSPALSST